MIDNINDKYNKSYQFHEFVFKRDYFTVDMLKAEGLSLHLL